MCASNQVDNYARVTGGRVVCFIVISLTGIVGLLHCIVGLLWVNTMYKINIVLLVLVNGSYDELTIQIFFNFCIFVENDAI